VKTNCDLESAMNTFIEFLIEARKQERRTDRGAISQAPHIEFNVKELLIHTALQIWPLPHVSYCPCSFCDQRADPSQMELHLAVRHSQFFLKCLFYSELHLKLAVLLGINIQVQKRDLCKNA
jgi:hypothetical protein